MTCARYLDPDQIIRRRDMAVHVAHTRLRQDSGGQAARGQTRQASRQTTDPVTIAESGSARLIEIKRRFEICKTCNHSRDNGFACNLYPDCCFGKYRAILQNHCRAEKW